MGTERAKGTKGTIAIVPRVSDVKGRDKRGDRFISPQEQIAKATGYCRADGYDVLVVEPGDLNVSHTIPLDERPGMSEALRLVEAGVVVGVGVSSQDRIGTLMLTRELKRRLIEIGGILKVADNPSAEILDAKGFLKLPSETMSLYHEAQREEIGLRWEAARRNARERGVLPARSPYGYRRDKDGRVVIATKQAQKIRDAARRRATGESWASIARSYGWPTATLRKRLKTETYLGIPGLVPAILTRAEYDAAQAGRTTRQVPPGKTTAHLLLQGLARCSSCGKTLKVVQRKSTNDSVVQSYYCKNEDWTCASRAYVYTDRLEDYVIGWFERELHGTGRMLAAIEASDDLAQAQADAAAAREELGAYLEVASAVDREAFKRGQDARERKVVEADKLVRELSARVAGLPAGGPLARIWATLDVEKRRGALRSAFDRIEVDRGASGNLAGHVRVFWADGSLAEIANDPADARMLAA